MAAGKKKGTVESAYREVRKGILEAKKMGVEIATGHWGVECEARRRVTLDMADGDFDVEAAQAAINAAPIDRVTFERDDTGACALGAFLIAKRSCPNGKEVKHAAAYAADLLGISEFAADAIVSGFDSYESEDTPKRKPRTYFEVGVQLQREFAPQG